ncbi:MAG: S-layer homology domain-containing protein [bacterium]|nr:S-layer homology domain-containing protein [bacterium]
MKFTKFLSAALIAAAIPAVPGVYAGENDALFEATYDMEDIKQNDNKEIVLTEEVPDGDYTVIIRTGGDTETNANIYINGGERVRAYTLEAGKTQENVQPVVPKDGKIEVKVLGENPNVTDIEIKQMPDRTEKGEKPTIYIAGDSTAQTYDYAKTYPQTGWGQVFADYFTDDVIVENRSMGGRSSKSYDNDGRLDRILTEMHPGDYVFIQFGINDGAENKPERYISVPDYKELITNKYIGEIKKRGGIPVLLTATAASWWDEENSCFMESRQDYAVPTREIAEETGVDFIDVNEIMTDTWNKNKKDEVLSFYFICEPLESKAYPAGTDDHTHLKEAGARAVARLIADEVADNMDDLCMYVKPYEEKFTDTAGHWCEEKANILKEAGIVKGVREDEFMPDKQVTRAEYLEMIMRACGIPGHAYREGECLDVLNDDWYCYAVQSALDKGLIPPEMLGDCGGTKIVEKIIEEAKEDTEAVTTEVTVYEFTQNYDTEIYSKGRVEMKFDGDKPITREEMAALTMNCASYMMKNFGSGEADMTVNANTETFTDEDEINPEYINAVEAAKGYSFIKGMGDGSFCPKETLTRAQAASVAGAALAMRVSIGG